MKKEIDWTKILLFVKEKSIKFLKWMLGNWKNFLLVLFFVLSLVFFFNMKSLEGKYENIIQKKDDEISLYKNKAGELYSQNETYVTDIKNLKISNEELYAEVKKLKDNPIIVTKIKTETVIKEKEVHDTVYQKDGNFVVEFKETDPWYGIYGKTSINPEDMAASTVLDSLYFKDDLTVDLIEKGKELSFIVKSANPYSRINNINGAVISPEQSKVLKKRFDSKWNIVGGVGPSLILINGEFKVVPAVQVTIGRKIFSF